MNDDAPRDPVSGRVPPNPDDLRDPTTVPMWPVGYFNEDRPPERDDKTGITEVERRLIDVIEKEYAQLRHYKRGSARWGEVLCATQGAFRALQSLYWHPWRGEHPWENEGASEGGYKISLEWAARIY